MINQLILKLLGGINFLELLLLIHKSGGDAAVKRFVTVPEKVVRKVCARTGADPEKALEERNEMAEETVEFVTACIDEDFEDPD